MADPFGTVWAGFEAPGLGGACPYPCAVVVEPSICLSGCLRGSLVPSPAFAVQATTC